MLFKKVMIVLAVLLLIVTVPVMAQEGEEEQETAEQEVAAVVDGEEITIQEVDRYAQTEQVIMSLYQANQEFTMLLLQSEPGQELIREYQKRKLDEVVIPRILLLNEARERGLEYSQEEKDAAFEEHIEEIKEQNDIGEQQLQQELQQQGFGSLEEYKKLYMENELLNRLQDAIMAEVDVTEQEVEDYYEQNKAEFEQSEQVEVSHILFRTEEKTEEEALAEANNVLEKLEAGEDFASLATEYSEGPSADRGGQLGFINRGEMVPEFEKVAFALETGEISEPVKTEYGYHLIKVTDKKEAGEQTFEDVRADIEKEITGGRASQIWQDLVRSLRDKAEIDIKL